MSNKTSFRIAYPFLSFTAPINGFLGYDRVPRRSRSRSHSCSRTMEVILAVEVRVLFGAMFTSQFGSAGALPGLLRGAVFGISPSRRKASAIS